ncbi:MAG: L,D-transpeptidase [Verrucomicrobiota bacterium]
MDLRLPYLLFLSSGALLVGCAVTSSPPPFQSIAYQPTDAKNITIKVSLQTMNTYVLEGDKLLLATPVTIGTDSDPTPTGDFKVFQKIERKRSNTYGFHVAASGEIRPGERRHTPSGDRYVGYPMPYWLEFHPGYGFHSGGVWPQPRSHGCLRVHHTVAPKLFAMCPTGTKVIIADSLPEDATVGKMIVRPTDYADPDPPPSVLITSAAFPPPPSHLYQAGPAPLLPQ